MAGIIKTDKRQGNIIGVANCASFGKQKLQAQLQLEPLLLDPEQN